MNDTVLDREEITELSQDSPQPSQDSKETPEPSACKQLQDYIGCQTIIERPRNLDPYRPWGTHQQAAWAILQVKMAIGFNAGRDYKEAFLDEGDSIGPTDDPAFIGLHSLQLVPLTRDPQLLKLSVKAYAECAKVETHKVTTCSAMRAGFWRSALNLIKEPTCVAVADEVTARRLIDFADAELTSDIDCRLLRFNMQ
mgnify:CR=1 FL=1